MNLEIMTKTNNNSVGAEAFANLLDNYEQLVPHRGQFLQGEVLRIEDDVLYVDVGAKRDAIVPYRDLDKFDSQEIIDNISRGDEIPVYVTRTPMGDEELLVSLKKGLEHHDWIRAEEDAAEDKLLELEVVGHNKGGLLVAYGHLEAFVPNSHIPSLQHTMYDKQELARQKALMVGETISAKILEVDPKRKRLVMSAKAAEKEARLEQLRAIEVGQIVTGRVDNIVNYGAFVDLGHLTGLLHISEIAWKQIGDPSDLLTVGEEIKVQIKRIDEERERIALSRKALLPSPWEAFSEKYKIGDLIEGEITGLVDFGAFVTLPSGIEGLIHVSEINLPVDASPAEVLQIGERVLVRIINIQPEEQRIGLSLRRVSAAEEIKWLSDKREAEAKVEADVEADADVETVADVEAETEAEEVIAV
ncbi:MAG: S1 RNA-binding domain-containing protein [Candidatus Promineifilaceae bacterium]